MAKRVRQELLADRFAPDHACFFSEPKQSGLLRHKSILTIGDHLVYQAIANIIADKIYPTHSKLYGTSVFGNLYSGSGNKYFLQDWRKSYRAFNLANEEAFASGQVWLAEFDFASFYDSIGHELLSRLLQAKYGVGADLCVLLERLLEKWTSASDGDGKKLPRFYLKHGIPQGPLPSPILAEVILSYIDEYMVKSPDITYLRYADDIRIWGQDEPSVRHASAVLDRLAKNVGVFPQAKKVGIKKVLDVNEILKTVSLPITSEEPDDEDFEMLEKDLRGEPPLQRLWQMLKDFTLSGDLENVTQFKFLLGVTTADVKVAERLCDLISRKPELTETCCYYIERCTNVSDLLTSKLFNIIDLYPGYPWIAGRFLRLLWPHRKEIIGPNKRILKAKLRTLYKKKDIRTDCQLQSTVRLFMVEYSLLKTQEIEDWASADDTPWWSLVFFILRINPEKYGSAALVGLLQKLLNHPSREVSRAAAYRLCVLNEVMPSGPMNDSGECQAIFQRFGLASSKVAHSSRINHLFKELLISERLNFSSYRKTHWEDLLGDKHSDVLKYAVYILAESGADRNQFILYFDSALEIVFNALWTRGGYSDVDISGKALRNNSRGCRLRSQTQFGVDLYGTRQLMISINNLRNRCDLAHATNNFTRTANRRITYSDIKSALTLIPAALAEIGGKYPE